MLRRFTTLLSLIFVINISVGQPIIGVSANSSSSSATVSLTYIKAVRNSGGVPVVIPMTTDTLQIAAYLNTITGLVMSGGADVNPVKYYNEEPHPKMGEIDPLRDEFDYLLIKMALKKGIPILAICRGHQMLNVVLGGSLIQDIPSQVKSSMVDHNQNAPSSCGTHTISIKKGSLLYDLLGKGETVVNSFHHQALKKVPPTLKVIAKSKDGVIEAVEGCGEMRVLGLQFHPEGFASHGQCEFTAIFDWLINEAKIAPLSL